MICDLNRAGKETLVRNFRHGDRMMIAGARCPSCGNADLEVFASRDRIRREVALREQFFAERIEGHIDRPLEKDQADVARGDTAEILLCRDCDILVRREENPPRFETDHYEMFAMERMLRAHISAYRRKRRRYQRLLPRGAHIVEVGSYVGGFLHVANEWGWDAMGVDVGKDTSRFARAHGYRTLDGPLENCRLEARAFDGVFIWNCFEQIEDPKALLGEVRRIMKPRGVMVIRTPNAHFYRAFDDPTLLGHSNLLGFPHLYGFTMKSLERFVASSGFKPVSHWTAPHIDPGIRPLTVTAKREATQLASTLRRSWIEATFLHE
jgi:SAM-dependent methyltransferase